MKSLVKFWQFLEALFLFDSRDFVNSHELKISQITHLYSKITTFKSKTDSEFSLEK